VPIEDNAYVLGKLAPIKTSEEVALVKPIENTKSHEGHPSYFDARLSPPVQ